MSGTQKDIGIKASHNAETSGFEKPSQAEYNKAHGRKADAPLSGGDRQATYDSLLSAKAER